MIVRKNDIPPNDQSGFWHVRSTMGNLITIKTKIDWKMHLFGHKQIFVMASLNISKAYNYVGGIEY